MYQNNKIPEISEVKEIKKNENYTTSKDGIDLALHLGNGDAAETFKYICAFSSRTPYGESGRSYEEISQRFEEVCRKFDENRANYLKKH